MHHDVRDPAKQVFQIFLIFLHVARFDQRIRLGRTDPDLIPARHHQNASPLGPAQRHSPRSSEVSQAGRFGQPVTTAAF